MSHVWTRCQVKSQSFFVLCTLSCPYLHGPSRFSDCVPIPTTSVRHLSIVYCYGFSLTCFFWSSDQYLNLPGPLPWRWCVSAVQLSLASQIRDLDGNLILKQSSTQLLPASLWGETFTAMWTLLGNIGLFIKDHGGGLKLKLKYVCY